MTNKHVFKRKISPLLYSSALLLVSTVANADMAPLSMDSDYLFGDWGGYRSELKKEGVDFQVNYTMESASNLAGGYNTSTTARSGSRRCSGSFRGK